MISYTVALKFMVDLKSEMSAHYFYWFKQVCVHLVFIFKIPFFKCTFFDKFAFLPQKYEYLVKNTNLNPSNGSQFQYDAWFIGSETKLRQCAIGQLLALSLAFLTYEMGIMIILTSYGCGDD